MRRVGEPSSNERCMSARCAYRPELLKSGDLDGSLRSGVIWHRPDCQPESVRDRPTRAHEHLFLLSERTSPSQ